MNKKFVSPRRIYTDNTIVSQSRPTTVNKLSVKPQVNKRRITGKIAGLIEIYGPTPKIRGSKVSSISSKMNGSKTTGVSSRKGTSEIKGHTARFINSSVKEKSRHVRPSLFQSGLIVLENDPDFKPARRHRSQVLKRQNCKEFALAPEGKIQMCDAISEEPRRDFRKDPRRALKR